jgi:hypothetical protein
VLGEPKEITQVNHDYGQPIQVSGIEISLSVPFEGDSRFFQYQPNSYLSAPPSGFVAPGKTLWLTVSGRNLDGALVRRF